LRVPPTLPLSILPCPHSFSRVGDVRKFLVFVGPFFIPLVSPVSWTSYHSCTLGLSFLVLLDPPPFVSSLFPSKYALTKFPSPFLRLIPPSRGSAEASTYTLQSLMELQFFLPFLYFNYPFLFFFLIDPPAPSIVSRPITLVLSYSRQSNRLLLFLLRLPWTPPLPSSLYFLATSEEYTRSVQTTL